MSTYYILVNYDLKEFLCTGCIGQGLKDWSYEYGDMGKLFIKLFRYDYDGKTKEKQYSPTEKDFYIQGHWNGGCRIDLMDEHDELYDKTDEEGTDWMNITPPCVIEHNEYAYTDPYKLKLEICNSHHDKSSNYWREKLKQQ